MRTLLGFAIAIALAIAVIVLAPAGQQSGPAPIVHGRDACDGCRMRLDRPGYAAEVERDGRFLKFDDIGCLVQAVAPDDAPASIWLEDHGTGELVSLAEATLVRSGTVRTPMGSGVVAFRDRAAAARHREDTQGEIVTIDQLKSAQEERRS